MNKQQLKKTTVEGDFIFHEEWLEIFQNYSVEQAGQVIKALVDYAKDGTLPGDSEIAALCTFLLANVDIDRSRIVEAHRPIPRRKKTTNEKYVKIPYRFGDKASLLIAPKLNMTMGDIILWNKIIRRANDEGMVQIYNDKDENMWVAPQEAFILVRRWKWKLVSYILYPNEVADSGACRE